MKKRFRAVDLFCGAGGTTTGAIQSGHVEVVAAINHWRVACLNHGPGHVVVPWIYQIMGRGAGRHIPPEQPLPTIIAQRNCFGVVAPFLIDVHNRRRDDTTTSVDDPMPTIVTKPGNSVCLPFITKYNSNGGAESVEQPLSTVTTKHRHGLAIVHLIETMNELGIADIGFRMLDVDELAAAQGFPVGYDLHGSKAEQIKQVGNSVHTAVARALCEAIATAD